jgi:hypothetical protein
VGLAYVALALANINIRVNWRVAKYNENESNEQLTR